MTAQEIIEKIRAEIERWMCPEHGFVLEHLLDILDTLEKECEKPTTAEGLEEEENIFANKDLNKEWKKFIEQEKKENHGDLPCYGDFGVLRIARHFAQWQKEQMMKEAVECEVTETCGIASVWIKTKQFKPGQKVPVIIVKGEGK